MSSPVIAVCVAVIAEFAVRNSQIFSVYVFQKTRRLHVVVKFAEVIASRDV